MQFRYVASECEYVLEIECALSPVKVTTPADPAAAHIGVVKASLKNKCVSSRQVCLSSQQDGLIADPLAVAKGGDSFERSAERLRLNVASVEFP